MAQGNSSNNLQKGGIGCGILAIGGILFTPIIFGTLVVVIIFGAAGGILGWLFGGGEPQEQGNAYVAPANAPYLYTPTSIPASCLVTPTPIGVTATPASTPVSNGSNTASSGGGGPIIYLPTPTACPLSFFSTPNPNFPAVGAFGQGNYDIRQGQIELATVQHVLAQFPMVDGSPNVLLPYAQRFIDFQSEYHLNAAYALAQAENESSMCTTGISPSAIECFNILWTSGGGCVTHNYAANHDFCGYANWSSAIEAWFRLMTGYYIPNGLVTVPAIAYTYAPCSDNGGCDFVNHYIQRIEENVTAWGVRPEAASADDTPHGNPFHAKYVVTQGYGCTDYPEFKDQGCAVSTGGTAPWFHRGVDIVSMADPTVFATISGQVIFAGYTGDGFGNRIYVQQGPYLVIYPHLSRILVATGQMVSWGDPIGVEGSTGYSSGDHLHYEIHINGAWVDSTPYLETP